MTGLVVLGCWGWVCRPCIGAMSYKVVMVGHNSVGKTSLAVRFVEGVFTHQEATIGDASRFMLVIAAAFFAKSVLVKEDTGGKSTNRDAKITQKLVRMEIWDTAGNSICISINNSND
eukprot:1324010-Amorphochlora_amoeboformis.AAC.1